MKVTIRWSGGDVEGDPIGMVRASTALEGTREVVRPYSGAAAAGNLGGNSYSGIVGDEACSLLGWEGVLYSCQVRQLHFRPKIHSQLLRN